MLGGEQGQVRDPTVRRRLRELRDAIGRLVRDHGEERVRSQRSGAYRNNKVAVVKINFLRRGNTMKTESLRVVFYCNDDTASIVIAFSSKEEQLRFTQKKTVLS